MKKSIVFCCALEFYYEDSSNDCASPVKNMNLTGIRYLMKGRKTSNIGMVECRMQKSANSLVNTNPKSRMAMPNITRRLPIQDSYKSDVSVIVGLMKVYVKKIIGLF